MDKHTRLLQEAAIEAKAARQIAETADAAGRDQTADERADFNAHFTKAVELKTKAEVAKADGDVLAQAKAIAEAVGLGDGAGGDIDATGAHPTRSDWGHKSLGEIMVGSAQFKSMLAPYKGRPVPQQARLQSDPVEFKSLIHGGKALLTGEDATSAGAFVVTERSDIVEVLGRRALGIRDLVSVRRTGSDLVEFVRQTSHTNNAAAVAEATSSESPTAPVGAGALLPVAGAGTKPQGAWAFEVASTAVKTIAEWVPVSKRALSDVAQLEGLINDELRADLEEAEEDQILKGNGSGQNFTGILNTSGIQTQAKGADTLFDAILRGITKARTVGRVSPSAIVVNPAEVEKILLAKDTQGRYFGSGPFSTGPNTLWGVPLVASEAQTAGIALLGDFSKAVLWDREQSSVTMTDSHEDYFARNLVAILAEERLAFAVTRPTAFVTVTGL